MEKAEKILSFKQKAPEIIKSKVMAYENPLEEMVIYATQKSKYFSKDSDIILLCLTNQYGYGKWREIKKAVRRDSRFRFDHLFLSRNEQELQRRVDILVKALEKEDQVNRKKLEQLGNAGDDGFGDEDMLMEDNSESEESKLPNSKLAKSLTSRVKKQELVSDDSSDEEPNGLNHKLNLLDVQDNDEHDNEIKDPSQQLRLGNPSYMQYTQSDEENEEVKINQTGNKVKPAKKKNGGGPKMKNTSKDSLKQTKLSFSNNKDCKG